MRHQWINPQLWFTGQLDPALLLFPSRIRHEQWAGWFTRILPCVRWHGVGEALGNKGLYCPLRETYGTPTCPIVHGHLQQVQTSRKTPGHIMSVGVKVSCKFSLYHWLSWWSTALVFPAIINVRRALILIKPGSQCSKSIWNTICL